MASEFAREVAADCWIAPTTQDRVLDPAVAEVFAAVIDRYLDLLGVAWGIISELQWPAQRHGWQMAAERFRDSYFALRGVPATHGASAAESPPWKPCFTCGSTGLVPALEVKDSIHFTPCSDCRGTED